MKFNRLKMRLALATGGFLGTGFGHFATASAADQPNVMIVGEDADEDTVPRHSRVFNRVDDALQARMMELGFKVYNETASTMDITNPGRVRRTDAELLTVARSVADVPIDVVASFQVYASTLQNAYADLKQLRIRVVGRLVQVQTGRALGSFEASVGPRGLRPLPVQCDRECVLEHVGDEAKPVADEVGLVLARKLEDLSPRPRSTIAEQKAVDEAPSRAGIGSAATCSGLSTAYTIVLDGYEPREVDDIEATLAAFSGYEHHRPLRTQGRHAEYWYETCSDRARLERNLRTLADQLPGHNRLALSGNRFEIEKVSGPAAR